MARVGDILPELQVRITNETIVRYCGAADDYSPQHWNPDEMRALGFQDIIAHGWLTFAHMCRVVQMWAPPEVADITAYEVNYKRTVYAGEARYGGSVVAVRTSDVDLDLWAQNAAGETMATATLTVRFV
jgi:acyl dehydratase